ncbi:MAG: NusG domain II-containing protein [Lachnospiraceae bacterium]|nr:NusG domain II-containing protein [Lachnospiraceae bacterium]
MKKLLSSTKRMAALLTALIMVLLAVSILALAFPSLFRPKNDLGRVAEIYQDGILIKSIPLTPDGESISFRVEGRDGAFNVIEVRNGSIAVTSASCPDKLCVHQGFHSDSLLPITCLPNHLVIRIRDLQETDLPDALTY